MAKHLSLEGLFAALADETRLRILNLVAGQEVCVCFFVEALHAPQPKISRHLAFLRRAGLVKARRDGKWMHYSLAVPQDPSKGKVLRAALEALAGESKAREDKKRLK